MDGRTDPTELLYFRRALSIILTLSSLYVEKWSKGVCQDLMQRTRGLVVICLFAKLIALVYSKRGMMNGMSVNP